MTMANNDMHIDRHDGATITTCIDGMTMANNDMHIDRHDGATGVRTHGMCVDL